MVFMGCAIIHYAISTPLVFHCPAPLSSVLQSSPHHHFVYNWCPHYCHLTTFTPPFPSHSPNLPSTPRKTFLNASNCRLLTDHFYSRCQKRDKLSLWSVKIEEILGDFRFPRWRRKWRRRQGEEGGQTDREIYFCDVIFICDVKSNEKWNSDQTKEVNQSATLDEELSEIFCCN